MSNNETRKSSRWLIILAVLGIVAVAALFAGSVWQDGVAQSKTDDADSHLATAGLLEEAGVEGQAAATLVNEYVASGDETLIPQIQEHTAAGVQNLTAGIAEVGEDPNGFVAQGSTAVEALGQVIALRQAGDTAGAVAALEQLSPAFASLVSSLEGVVASERAAAASATDSADSADSLSSSLAVSAGALLILIALVGIVRVGRTLLKRSTVGAPTTG